MGRVDVFASFCARKNEYYQQGLPCKKSLTLKYYIMIKWNTVEKILQIVATVITTILGTNIIQSCMNA